MAQETLTLSLNYAGQLAGEAGLSEESIEVSQGAALVEVLRSVASRHGGRFQELLFDEENALRRALIVSVDDRQVADPCSLTLTENHEVFLMTPIAGG
jgi:molybdopterin converting factor small subunit